MLKKILLTVIFLMFSMQVSKSYTPDYFDVDFNNYLLRMLTRFKYVELNATEFSKKYTLTQYFLNSDPVKMTGFIGNELERIKVKINSAQQDTSNPGIYKISGLTKVDKNISAFNGSVKIRSVYEFQEPITKHGLVICRFASELKEEGSGPHKGKFVGDYYLVMSKVVEDVRFAKVTPHFLKNHSFAGCWKSANGKIIYPAYWGEDYVLEDLEDVFYGITQFSPLAPAIIDKSWKSYLEAYTEGTDEEIRSKALELEQEIWWE